MSETRTFKLEGTFFIGTKEEIPKGIEDTPILSIHTEIRKYVEAFYIAGNNHIQKAELLNKENSILVTVYPSDNFMRPRRVDIHSVVEDCKLKLTDWKFKEGLRWIIYYKE